MFSATAKASVPQPSYRENSKPYIIVGTGPVGIRTAQELLRVDPTHPMLIFGNEPWEPYNRVRLSSLLAGQVTWPEIVNTLDIPKESDIVQHHNCAIVAVDRAARTVTDIIGQVHSYSKLILAVGSRPHIPAIPGMDKSGVFTFRDMNDVTQLMARSARSHRTVILGGGLLGIEAARALQRANTEIIMIQHSARLMGHQLDDDASEFLRSYVTGLGVEVILSDSVKHVVGDDRVSGVQLRSGKLIHCDTLVLATGIRPNVELARQLGLRIGQGIKVDDQLRTSDPNIYAVGECAEHRGRVYGLVAPGLDHASVAAHDINGKRVSYLGSTAVARLKVVDFPMFSMGAVVDDEIRSTYTVLTYRGPNHQDYRKVVLHRGRLVGALAIGEWGETGRVQEAVTVGRRIWPWQLWKFRRTGCLWPDETSRDISQWPASVTVCNCTGVTRGTLSSAMAGGCDSVASLADCTGASTVCGSCKPMLAQLVGAKAEPINVKGSKTLTWLSLVGLVAVIAVALLSPIPFLQTVQTAVKFDVLWLDNFWKQVSGFTLLGVTVVALLLSLRKRVKRFAVGEYGFWRVAHAALGIATVAMLIIHTGMRFGDNLNWWLMSCFTAIALLGAVAGGTTAMESGSGSLSLGRWRRWSTWTHIVLFWPLPVLLGFHILKSYYY